MSHSNIRAVIFDMDGLLVDSEPVHFKTNQIFYRRFGKRFTNAHIQRFLGVRINEEVAQLKKEWGLKPPVETLIEQREALFHDLIKTSLRLASGARSLLLFLKKNNIPMGIGTSAQTWYLELVLQRFHLHHLFFALVAGDDVARSKPHPEVYLKVAQELGVPPSSCLVLEDAVNGVRAAKAAGMCCFAVPGPYLDTSKFTMADGIFPSLIQVKHNLELSLKSKL